MMAGVDIVLGPLLTLCLFKSAKKGLLLDMSLIAVFQISALLYGAYTIYSQRPSYIVFAYDKFDVVAKSEVYENQIPAEIKKIGFFDKPEFVYQPRSGNSFNDELVFSFTADENSPDRLSANVRDYLDYSSNRDVILKNIKSVNDSPELINEGVDKELRYAVVVGNTKRVIVLLDPIDASVSGYSLKTKLLGL